MKTFEDVIAKAEGSQTAARAEQWAQEAGATVCPLCGVNIIPTANSKCPACGIDLPSDTHIFNLRRLANALVDLTKPRHHEFNEEESDEGPDPVDAQAEQEMEQERRVGW